MTSNLSVAIASNPANSPWTSMVKYLPLSSAVRTTFCTKERTVLTASCVLINAGMGKTLHWMNWTLWIHNDQLPLVVRFCHPEFRKSLKHKLNCSVLFFPQTYHLFERDLYPEGTKIGNSATVTIAETQPNSFRKQISQLIGLRFGD